MITGSTSNIPPGGLDWGDLRRMDPVSDRWGYDRGLPVDRYYIEGFLRRNAGDVRGRCIEVLNAAYTRRFGGDRVTEADVVDINPANDEATVVADLTVPGALRAGYYDCFVLTQTLPVVYDGRALVRTCYEALRPGGVLLVTAPSLCRYSPHPEDHWRMTDRSMTRLLTEETDGEDVEVEMFGNLVTSIAFLTGVASEELEPAELDHRDGRFPVVVTARLRKPVT
jgi:hypothetical protein